MRKLFPQNDFPDACNNTLKILDRVHYEFKKDAYYLPDFPIEDKSQNADEFLKDKVFEGAKNLYGALNDDQQLPYNSKKHRILRYRYRIFSACRQGRISMTLLHSGVVGWMGAMGPGGADPFIFTAQTDPGAEAGKAMTKQVMDFVGGLGDKMKSGIKSALNISRSTRAEVKSKFNKTKVPIQDK